MKSLNRRLGVDRRYRGLLAEPLERHSERREEERRDSPRVRHALTVKDAFDGERQAFDSELSLGGASWKVDSAPSTHTVEVRFALAGDPDEFVAPARVVRTLPEGNGLRVHAVFEGLEVARELKLAKYLEQFPHP